MQIRTRSRSVKTFGCKPRACLSSLLTSAGHDVSNPVLLNKQRHNPVPLMLECLYHFSHNSHDQFYFMVQIISCHRIRHLSTFRTNCICRFAEEKRSLIVPDLLPSPERDSHNFDTHNKFDETGKLSPLPVTFTVGASCTLKTVPISHPLN